MVVLAVHGSASRFLPAERGTVRLSIEVEDTEREVVVRQVAALHARFAGEAQALVASGAATWWGSQQVWVRSEHRYDGGDERGRVVQIATAEVLARFRDFEALSVWVLQAGSEAGVSVNRIEWAVTDEHRLETERVLRILAVQDAMARARAYASAVGGTEVVLEALWEAGLRSDAGGVEPRWKVQAMAERRSQPGIELRPDDIELSASVTADFRVDLPG